MSQSVANWIKGIQLVNEIDWVVKGLKWDPMDQSRQLAKCQMGLISCAIRLFDLLVNHIGLFLQGLRALKYIGLTVMAVYLSIAWV